MTITRFRYALRHAALAATAAAALAGCAKQKGPSPVELLRSAAPHVTVAAAEERATPVTSDLVGEVKAFREVELRPRASGLVDKLYFRAGQRVSEGDVLFRIDPQQYQAAIDDKRAAVAEAEAALARSRQDVERYRPLVPDNAIPKQTFDQAVAQADQHAATVASRKAALEKAELDLGYTRVRSPVSGQIGLQKVEEGAYVAAGTTPLAVVSTLDPVYVYFTIAETEYIEVAKKNLARVKSGSTDGTREVAILLPDGTVYQHRGRVDFVERAIATTGTLTVRARVANPDFLLRPGLNVRVRVDRERLDHALLIPQRAVGDLLGKQYVLVVDAENTVAQRMVELGDRVGADWIVKSGLQPGERVVVDGVHKARAGAKVQLATTTATAAAAQ